MITESRFYARLDTVSDGDWELIESISSAEDLADLDGFWAEDPGYSGDEKHSAYMAIVAAESEAPASLREWVLQFRALILLGELSPRAADEYLESEAWENLAGALWDFRSDVYGDAMYGAAGRRIKELLDYRVLDIPITELKAADTGDLREILLQLEMLVDSQDVSFLIQRVRLTVDGQPPSNPELKAAVADFLYQASDVFTWLFLLDLGSPGAVEVIARYWKNRVADWYEENDDDDTAASGAASLTDKFTDVVEHSLLNEYDEYASRYGVGLEQWEDWCQSTLSHLPKLALP